MGWGAAIAGLLSSLPTILDMFKTFAAWLQKVSGGDIPGFIDKANNAFTLLHKAQTEEEVIAAAKAIQDVIRGTRT